MQAVRADIKPGIYQGIPNEAYHAGPGISKSGLWTIHETTPAHYKWPKPREPKPHFDVGDAIHKAILEPEKFEAEFVRGPDDRRGNKWKDQLEICTATGKTLLTSSDFDSALAVRDAVHADAWINSIVTQGERMVEASGYWIDPETGVLCRCRPDLYRRDLKIILDVKSTRDASPKDFAKSCVNYGYHSQEAFYTDGWRHCGEEVDAFVFLAFEKESPYAKAVYELPPSIVEEGRAIIRQSLDLYGDCVKRDEWPAYGDGVQELTFPRWAYTKIEAPGALDAEVAA
jgi:hypothetical protein